MLLPLCARRELLGVLVPGQGPPWSSEKNIHGWRPILSHPGRCLGRRGLEERQQKWFCCRNPGETDWL